MFTLILVGSTFWITLSSGSGICTKQIQEPVTRRIAYKTSYLKTFWGTCRWYGETTKCLQSSILYKDEFKTRNDVIHETIQYCCDGYKQETEVPLKCIPHCENNCFNGYCEKPGVCRCKNGFALLNGICIPACSHGCINSMCIAPEICQCLEGYTNYTYNSCIPSCDPPCKNGKCMAPGKCVCEKGYIHDNEENKCVPLCLTPCINGVCVAPDKCECNIGYQINPNTDICEPVCSQLCINSTCLRPETCVCFEGYKKQTNTTCIPHCSAICENGMCIAPEKCKCLPGYGRDFQNFNKCNPVCRQDCVNGKCIGPDTCLCFEGFKPEGQFICKPICSKKCNNGECIAPEKCGCWEGYEQSEEANTCVPTCTNSCVNGKCSTSNNCTCLEGYVQSNFTHVCNPFCSKECSFGKCTAPETCTCDPGYRSEEGICRPVCEKCINGYCSSPQNCSCFDGFKLNLRTNECEISCQDKCINGYCTKDGLCKCLDGYKLSEKNQTCTHCKNECTNETCLENSLEKTECIPFCINECNHGSCIEPNTCACDYPFISNPLNRLECILDYAYFRKQTYSSLMYYINQSVTNVVTQMGKNRFLVNFQNITLRLELNCNHIKNKYIKDAHKNMADFTCLLKSIEDNKMAIIICLPKLDEKFLKLNNKTTNREKIINNFTKQYEKLDLNLVLLIPEISVKGENEFCTFCLENNNLSKTFMFGTPEELIFTSCKGLTELLGNLFISFETAAYALAACVTSIFLTLLIYFLHKRINERKITGKKRRAGQQDNWFINAAYEFQKAEYENNKP